MQYAPPCLKRGIIILTSDTDLWPTHLNINRGHLLIKDYLPTKFVASGAKRSLVISCTRWSRLAWPLIFTFDLLTWISIGVIYSSRIIYLPSLKLLGQSILELSVALGEMDWHDLWPTDLNINRGHLLIKDYLPTKFEASWAKHSWVISCTRLRDTDILIDRPTYQPTHAKQYAFPFSKEGINIHVQYLHITKWHITVLFNNEFCFYTLHKMTQWFEWIYVQEISAFQRKYNKRYRISRPVFWNQKVQQIKAHNIANISFMGFCLHAKYSAQLFLDKQYYILIV